MSMCWFSSQSCHFSCGFFVFDMFYEFYWSSVILTLILENRSYSEDCRETEREVKNGEIEYDQNKLLRDDDS